MLRIEVNGKDITYLETFASSYFAEYIRLRNKLSDNFKKYLPFGSFEYNIQLQYGKKYGFAILFNPASYPKLDIEYLIRADKLDMLIDGKLMKAENEKSIRILYPNQKVLLYYRENTKKYLTRTYARNQAKDHFTTDCQSKGIKLNKSLKSQL